MTHKLMETSRRKQVEWYGLPWRSLVFLKIGIFKQRLKDVFVTVF